MNDIGKKIEEIITNLNMNTSSFAERMNVHPTVLYNILKGRNKPSYDLIIKILETYNINSEWLLFSKGTMTKEKHFIENIECPSKNFQIIITFKCNYNGKKTMD